MKKIFALFCLFFVFVIFMSHVSAAAEQDPAMKELMREIKMLKDRVADLEAKLNVQDKKITGHDSEVKDHDEHLYHQKGVKGIFESGGFRIGAGATFIVQGTPNANNASGKEDSRVDGSYTVELEIEKELGDFGLAYLLMEPGQGQGLDDDLSLFSSVNFDAADTSSHLLVSQVWYEHYLYDNQIIVTGGKLYVPNYLDTNEYANDETAQFISSMFRNSTVLDLPDDTGLGLRCRIASDMFDFFDVELTCTEEDADWEDVLNHPFLSAQFNFMPAEFFDYDGDKWGGNYRAYLWYNGGDHAELVNTEKTKARNYGFGLSFDQKITEIYGVFARVGWQDPEVSNIEYNWSTGAQMTGEYWNREEDVFAIAIGQAISGKKYGDAGNPNNSETHIETYYAFKINDNLTLSPDFQIIWNPNGVSSDKDGDDDTIFVYGVRGQVGF
ncbi:MAG: carbohydrate porin [Candidatus Omnitrophota bacterium]